MHQGSRTRSWTAGLGRGALLLGAMALGVGCSGSDSPGNPSNNNNTNNNNNNNTDTLYARLGAEAGITTVINDFVGRVVGDAAINGYFLNAGVNGSRLGKCLVKQVGAMTGGPQTYPAEGEGPDADGCRNMKDAHQGMGISAQDFADLAGHLVAALDAAGVAAADRDAIVAAVSPLSGTIVEDAGNNASIYQRVGRKPAIATVVNDFVGRVVADPAINGYFLNASLDGARLGTCLVRQVCGLTGGPCVYGQGVEAELNGVPCKDMTDVHLGLGISTQDYNDLAGHLVAALTEAGVAQADIDTIGGALTAPAFVSTVVEDADSNATVYQRVGRKPAIKTVVDDFVGRVVADPQINGFFGNANAARLGTCLVRQVCSIDGPCKYGEGVEAELSGVPCKDMASSHAGLVDAMGNGIAIEDFNALAGHLVAALDAAGVTMSDRDALVGAIAPLCPDIVADPASCP
jgi:truncated hemoglobin YjbI